VNTYDILLNNSDTGVLRTIEWALKDRGLEVTAVSEPAAAIRALRNHHYDVVLTDVDPNYEKGFAVLNEAKNIDPETVVILLGCEGPSSFDMEKVPADVDEVIFAPCGTPKLWKRLSSCLERMELRRRDAHCRDGRRHLAILATEMKQLRDGAFGKMDSGATAKVSALLNSIEQMISGTDEHLAASSKSADTVGLPLSMRH
jgi:DNA-binding NtrC family response regulator